VEEQAMTIRNDATRATIRPRDPRRPRSVVARQGQVLLDADLDQQSRHVLDRIETETGDVLGSAGRLVVPASSAAFRITAAATPDACGIGAGHGYLDGWLVENRTAGALLRTQPHPRTDTTPAAPVLMALKALVRYVDSAEEPVFADPSLGDAQAAGRALVDWQVFPFAPQAGWGTAPSCGAATTHAEWQALAAPSTGTLTVVPDTAPPATDPCSLTPQGGYSRAENLLYRIEVHGGVPRGDRPTADGPRFRMNGLKVKLSRRNASVLARVTAVNGTDFTVQPPALDPLNWFAPGSYAELVTMHDDVDPRDAVARERLFQVARATDTVVRLEAAAAPLAASVKTSGDRWFLRLWDAFGDGAGLVTVGLSTAAPQQSQPVDLGDGLTLVMGTGADDTFRRGDHWTFAARADGSIDWPPGRAETPHGPETRYAPLAVVGTPPGPSTTQDCRVPTATLTDRALLYRGGDGQEVPAPPGGGFVALPGRLRIAVMRGRTPVAGAAIEWSMPAGAAPSRIGGSPVDGTNTATTVTDANGLGEVEWRIDGGRPDALHQVRAQLRVTGPAEGPALVFTAAFRTAAATSYEAGACELLGQTTTVQEALDVLCANVGATPEPPTLRLNTILLMGLDGNVVDLVRDRVILNGIELPHDAFGAGIALGTTLHGDKIRPDATPHPFDPIVEVELDLPYPTTDHEKIYWARASAAPQKRTEVVRPFGFQRMRFDGTVKIIEDPVVGLFWEPTEMAQAFLRAAPDHMWGHRIVLQDEVKASGWRDGEPDLILCRLRVRSAHVWAFDPRTDRRAYLSAEHLGTSERETERELLVEELDVQRAADLDMFFYLRLG
jgi:Family of unknown function (DUF6519)